MASSGKYTGASYTPAELSDPQLPTVIIRRAEIGFVDRTEESPSVGNNSTASDKNASTSDEQPKTASRKAARTTGNRSKAQTPEDSTADSTDGNGQTSATLPSADPFDF